MARDDRRQNTVTIQDHEARELLDMAIAERDAALSKLDASQKALRALSHGLGNPALEFDADATSMEEALVAAALLRIENYKEGWNKCDDAWANEVSEMESSLHQLSEDHSHCEDLLHELGARASSAESRLAEQLKINEQHARDILSQGDEIERLESRLAADLKELDQFQKELLDEAGKKIAAREERNAALDRLDTAQKTLAFFASVIRSGEPWSAECQHALDECNTELPDLVVERQKHE
jgi:DNA repair exonuclease SbcCD ATPase subunit